MLAPLALLGCATTGVLPPCEDASVISPREGVVPVDSVVVAGSGPDGGSVKPAEITNPEAVMEAMAREYPPAVRQEGIGAVVVVWVYVDSDGTPRRFEVPESSGVPELDAAALRVAEEIRFVPASRPTCSVASWTAFPLRFDVRLP
jgi:TonB family protein